MSGTVRISQNVRFKIGWVLLLVSAALMALNHFVLIFALDEPTLFIGYAAFNFYSLVVIYIPFRQYEKWAWYATWILPIGLAAPAYTDPNLAIFYYSVAVVCVLGLLLTMQVVRQKLMIG
jgi:hypothetical protein